MILCPGSHINLRKQEDSYNPVVVPLHKEINKDTLGNILRQANLSFEGFIKKIR
ncbi:MAG: addiction module toxin, HicA family [Candidatus Altiarchaeales archaeon]|nr:addiction module toxin, HicA family [Candidatus Altiarchaeales archaeon]